MKCRNNRVTCRALFRSILVKKNRKPVSPHRMLSHLPISAVMISALDYGPHVHPAGGEEAAMHFALLRTLAERAGLPDLSMGMGSNYAEAITFGATHVRVGSACLVNGLLGKPHLVNDMAGTAFLVSMLAVMGVAVGHKGDAVSNTDPGLFDLRNFVGIVGHQADR